jgi:hypothetical protein
MVEVARTLGVSSVAIHRSLPRSRALLSRRGLSPEDLIPEVRVQVK